MAVTHLREPVARHVSEFYYKGPGARLGATASNDSLSTSWAKWMRNKQKKCRFGPGEYHDDYFVRRLIGSCGACQAVSTHKMDHASARRRHPRFGRTRASHRPRRRRDPVSRLLEVPSPRSRGCEPYEEDNCAAKRPLGSIDFENAEKTLARFDVVLISERLGEAAKVVAAALGLRDAALETALQAGFAGTRITHRSGTAAAAGAGPAARPLPDEIRAALRKRNRADRRLYAVADARFSDAVAASGNGASETSATPPAEQWGDRPV